MTSPSHATRTLDALGPPGSALAAEAFLIVQLPSGPRVVPLPDGVDVVFGRSRACTIHVDDEAVSRRHAVVVRRGRDVFVRDLGSRNGTRVGTERIEGETLLQGGQTVAVGPLSAVVGVAAPVRGPIVGGADEGAVTRDLADVADAADMADVAGGDDAGATSTERSARTPAGPEVISPGPHVVADPAMAAIYEQARRIAATDLSVLIVGETGVGKELVAEAIARLGPRADLPFVAVAIGALPETTVESALFGHERGAFTGADRRAVGYFEAAGAGTLFLDEIGELSANVQAKLLRVLESRRFVRLGSTREIGTAARVVAATHRDLEAMVRAGKFREDLYFRLAGFRITVPPLRSRRSEIPLLATLFCRALGQRHGQAPAAIAADAHAALAAYDWPGNVRELRNVVEAAAVLAAPGDITRAHLPEAVRNAGVTVEVARSASGLRAIADLGQAGAPPTTPVPAPSTAEPGSGPSDLPGAVDKVERNAIVAALEACGGNQTHAARRLGISRRTLIYKMKRHDIRTVRQTR